jgi:hypothetical protein
VEYLLPIVVLGIAAIVVNKLAQRMKRADRTNDAVDQGSYSGLTAGSSGHRERDDRTDDRHDHDHASSDHESGSDGGGFDGGGDGGSD